MRTSNDPQGLLPLHCEDLRKVQIRIGHECACLLEKIAALEQKKNTLYVQGIQETAQRIQLALARQIQTISKEISGIQKTLRLLEQQGQLVGQLVYAQENHDLLDRPPFLGLDWNTILGSAQEVESAYQNLSTRLDGLLSVLEPAVDRPAVLAKAEYQPDESARDGELVKVKSIPDGDGINLEDGRRVRYIGMDAPEMWKWGGGSEPFAREAREFNRSLVEGKAVRLVREVSDTDRYGRLLRFVYVEDVCVNAEMLKAGLARVLTVKPNCGRAAEFTRLEEQAKKLERGMWLA